MVRKPSRRERFGHWRRRLEAEAWAKLAMESTQSGAWSWEPEIDAVECDDAAAALWGLTPDIRPSMTALDRLVPVKERPARQAALQSALDPNGGGKYLVQHAIVDARGRARRIEARGMMQFRDARPVRLIGIVRDITNQHQGHGETLEQEARLSGILAIAADAIISINEQYRIVMFNQGAERIFGYSRHEVIGLPLDILLPARYRAMHAGHIEMFARSGTTAKRMGERQAISGLRKDGSEFPAEASISNLTMGGNVTYTVVLRDVTDRKRLEQELEQRVAERTAEMKALLDAVPDGIVQTDIDLLIRMPNAAMVDMFGYRRDELIGMATHRLYARATDADAVAEAWRRLDLGASFGIVTVECRRKNGATFTAMARGNLVRDANGQTFGRVEILRDVSDEIKRQQALASAQRMEAFGQLTGGIAHDFNNLLTVISGNQELLELRLKDEKDLALLKRAQVAAEMGARLTSRLLTFARRGQIATSLISLNEQITAMVDLLRRSIGEQITLTTNLSPQLPLVRADPSEIENAVLNLAINARDAMPGGGTIVIETGEVRIAPGPLMEELKLEPGKYVRLSVTDTGSGMVAEIARRAFEPFFTTKQPGKGTGLGLSTIHGLAQQSGGTVAIDSEIGRGTTVNLYLPQASERQGQRAAGNEAQSSPGAAGESVLLVEDHPEVREVALERLTELGYAVDQCSSGADAIEHLLSSGRSYDLVFSDVVMPGGVSGYDLAKWVAIHAPHCKMLLASGNPGEIDGHVDDAIRDVRLLRKPYSREELARALRQLLDHE